MAASQQTSSQSQNLRIVEGSQLRCPHCEELGDPFFHFRPLQFEEKYENELFRVMQHRRDRGGCGHVFAPGDPWIIRDYLKGNLVDKRLLDQALIELEQLKQELTDARKQRQAVEA